MKYQMIFNFKQADYLVKKGVQVLGCGIHNKTKAPYVLFDKNSKEFVSAMDSWKSNIN